eukprot:Seg2947.5 transcript_id=Seg2947.5/GoldUCD/mRNA.D3Y31 product="Adhesion G protein-coupled receptor E1" protein_id=Seg2947.5/GoldUCD/D3Y31
MYYFSFKIWYDLLGTRSIHLPLRRSAYAFVGVHSVSNEFTWDARSLRRFGRKARYKGGITMGNSFYVKPDIDIQLLSTTCTGKGTPSCPSQSPVVIKVNGLQPKLLSSSTRKRGFIFVTVNPATGILEKAFHFDTHAQDVDLFTSMENIEKPRILLGVVKEDAYRRLSEGSKKYLQDTWLGKPMALSAAYEAYVFIGVNLDVKPVWVKQVRKARGAGRAHLNVKVPVAVRGCINPKDPESGKAKERRYKFLESASYQCNKGLIQEGIPAKCMVDGSWKVVSSGLPRCIPDAMANKGNSRKQQNSQNSDMDECSDGSATCPRKSECVKTDASYRCQCNRGYSLEGNVCVDVNECEDKSLYSCPPNSYCVNKVGMYECHCNKGYKHYEDHCRATDGPDSPDTTDADECSKGTHTCTDPFICHDLPGNYECRCKEGYKQVDDDACQDVNECENEHACPVNSECINSIGSFQCKKVRHNDWTVVLDILIGIAALACIVAVAILILRRRQQERHNKKLREKLLGDSLSDIDEWDRDFDPQNYFHTRKNFTE